MMMRRILAVAAFAVVSLFAAGCSSNRIFVQFSSPDATPLREGDVTIRCGYLVEVKTEPLGQKIPTLKTLIEGYPSCGSSVSLSVEGPIVWVSVDADYPGHVPLRFRVERAAADAPRLYELSELDLRYVPTDLKIVGDKNSVSVAGKLRFP